MYGWFKILWQDFRRDRFVSCTWLRLIQWWKTPWHSSLIPNRTLNDQWHLCIIRSLTLWGTCLQPLLFLSAALPTAPWMAMAMTVLNRHLIKAVLGSQQKDHGSTGGSSSWFSIFSQVMQHLSNWRFKSNMLVNLLGQWPTWRSCHQAQNHGLTENSHGATCPSLCARQDMDYGGESIPIGGTATQSAERPIDSFDSIDFAVCLQIIQGGQKHVRMSLCHVVFWFSGMSPCRTGVLHLTA